MTPDRYASVPERITWTVGFRLPIDKHVLGALSTFASFKTGKQAQMSLDALSKRARTNRRTLQRALRRLEADGFVSATRRLGAPTRYDINLDLLASCWTPVQSLLKTSGLGDSRVTPGDDMRVTPLPREGGDTGVTRSPVRTDPLYKDPLYKESPALRATLPPEQLSFGPLSLTEDEMRVYRARSQRNVGEPCQCPECREAGVTHLRRVRVPADDFCSEPRWLHGEDLRRWWATHDRELAEIRERLAR